MNNGWRAHLTGEEASEVEEYEWQRGAARKKVAEYSRYLAQIRNTCVQRARRSQVPKSSEFNR